MLYKPKFSFSQNFFFQLTWHWAYWDLHVHKNTYYIYTYIHIIYIYINRLQRKNEKWRHNGLPCTLTTIRLTFLIKALVGSTESMFACSMEFYWTGISPICTENKTQVFLLGLLVLANGKLTAAYQRSREGEGDRREKNRETQRPRREPKQTWNKTTTDPLYIS